MDRLLEFRVRFPEFRQVPDSMVQAAIADAMDETDATVWLPSHYEAAVRYRAAHKLALSPQGRSAGLTQGAAGKTTYWLHLESLMAGNVIGIRVSG